MQDNKKTPLSVIPLVLLVLWLLVMGAMMYAIALMVPV